MNIKFDYKFSEKQIDVFISNIHKNIIDNPKDKYFFDLTNTEWISNQGLLLLTSLLKYFIEKNIEFELEFIPKGTSTAKIPKRVAIQIVQIWEIWGIWKVIPNEEYDKYLGINYKTIQSLKRMHNLFFRRPEIYDGYGITPFLYLNKISNYDDEIIKEELSNYHSLNEATTDIVDYHNCEHPFVNGVFGNIISKEIYENFLDHFDNSLFNVENEYAFMSLSIKGRIEVEKQNNFGIDIQKQLQQNFETEELEGTKSFFLDEKTYHFKNLSYITYSFLDFGKGIPNTLKKQYLTDKNRKENDVNDSEILSYAFEYNSSRHPIQNPFNSDKILDFIPRGLFDVLSLVQRYKGVIIARSCNGKIIYNFSNTNDTNEACINFCNDSTYFPGTFITIYLPALPKHTNIDNSVIKPKLKIPTYKKAIKRIISIYDIVKEAELIDKKERYNYLFKEIKKHLSYSNKTLFLTSLKNITDSQLIKKIIFFLISSYDVNTLNNFIIFYPPEKKFLDEINYEISNLSTLDKNFKIHPLPFIYENKNKEIEVYWLGINNEKDKLRLNEILFDVFSLAKSDFVEPDSIIGHINNFDENGNLLSDFPNLQEIQDYINFFEVRELVKSSDYISSQNDYIYLCNGNYYQFEFYEMIKMINDKSLCDVVSKMLYENAEIQLSKSNSKFKKRKYITITSSSHKIAKSLLDTGLISEKDNIIFLDNYHFQNLDTKLPTNPNEYSYILMCDVLATGELANRLRNSLNGLGCDLSCISVIVNTVDKETEIHSKNYLGINDIVNEIYRYPIKKYFRGDSEIEPFLRNSKIIRINPYTNIPISFSIKETNPENIILSTDEFLNIINENHINTGLLIFNNLLHPYFFRTKEIIQEKGIELLKEIFSKKKKINGKLQSIINVEKQNLNIFYPKKSDIEYLDFKAFKEEILKGHRNIREFELERYNTDDGWKFPHTTDYFKKIVENNPVLILDDGSCTGASLKQMINEVSFFLPKKITLLCIIGRVSEHKREFLTSINSITKGRKNIEVEIFFGSYWHIPTYYLEENPNIKERDRLRNVLKLTNIPPELKKVTQDVFEILEPKEESNYKDYQFFPKSGTEIPKKEIIKVRDEIGKVVGYRYYKENFEFFNKFIRQYSFKDIKTDRYKTVELICAIISYEPHLYKKIKNILPDVSEKLVEFIDIIIFSVSKRLGSPPMILSYRWNIRDIFHLFFVMNTEKQIYSKLVKNDNFASLFNFINANDKTSLSYVLFKILNYFPLDINELPEKLDRKFLLTLKKFRDSDILDAESERKIKVFISFLYTLPRRKSYENQVDTLSKNFERMHDDRFHHNYVIGHLGYMLSDITSKINNYNPKYIETFKESWKIVSGFTEPILAFQKSYPSHFPEKVSKDIENISIIHSRLSRRIITGINDSNIDKIQADLTELQSSYFHKESLIFKHLISPTTSNLQDLLKKKIKEKNLEINIELDESITNDSILNFPHEYLSGTIFETVFNNFRHSDKTKAIKISAEELENDFIKIKITNTISKTLDSGGGNGISKLLSANNFPFNYFKFKHYPSENLFIQEITIKTI